MLSAQALLTGVSPISYFYHVQPEIYDQIGFASMLSGVLEGYHATIFAYGQVPTQFSQRAAHITHC